MHAQIRKLTYPTPNNIIYNDIVVEQLKNKGKFLHRELLTIKKNDLLIIKNLK